MINQSRRTFLKLMGATTVGLTLAACSLTIAPIANPEAGVTPMSTQQATIATEHLAALEASLIAEQKRYRVPGLAIAIVNATAILYQRGFGVRDQVARAPVTSNTLFRIASTTKACTAAMIATLVKEGRIAWDQPATELWPSFAMPTPELTAATRLSDLLSMRTGLQSTEAQLMLYGADSTPTSTLATLAQIPVAAPLGEQFIYQDQAYAAAGYLASMVADSKSPDLNITYAALMQERLFQPLGMDTAVIADDLARVGGDYATPYALDTAGQLLPVGYLPIAGYVPAGGIAASVTDLARFVQWQLQPDRDATQAAPLAAHTDMSAIIAGLYPYAESGAYGFGWTQANLKIGGTVVGHTGGIDGFSSELAFWPQLGVGIVLLNNLEPAQGGAFLNMAVRDTLLELITGQDPMIAARIGAAFQKRSSQADAQAATLQPPTRKAVQPYLGEYEHDWTLAWRATESDLLWLVRPHRELPLSQLADATYMVNAGPLLGTQISFTATNLTFIDTQGQTIDVVARRQ